MKLLRRETREAAKEFARAVLECLDAALFVLVMAILCVGWFVADLIDLCRSHARSKQS